MSERTDEAARTKQQRADAQQANRQLSPGSATGARDSSNGSVPPSSGSRPGSTPGSASDPDATVAFPKVTDSGPPPSDRPANIPPPPARNPFVPDPPGGFGVGTRPGDYARSGEYGRPSDYGSRTSTGYGGPGYGSTGSSTAQSGSAPSPTAWGPSPGQGGSVGTGGSLPPQTTPRPPNVPTGTPPMTGPGSGTPGSMPTGTVPPSGATARTVVIPDMSPDEKEKAEAKARAEREKRERADAKARRAEERKRARESAKAAKRAARTQVRVQTQAQLGRKARLKLIRVDPWSVMKTSFLLSIAFGVMCVISVFLVYSFLTAAGLWDNVNETVARLLAQKANDQFDINNYVTTSKVMGVTMLISAIDTVIITALATLGAFIYNLSASLLGGIEITLAEDQHQ